MMGRYRGYGSPDEALNPQVEVREGFLEKEVLELGYGGKRRKSM